MAFSRSLIKRNTQWVKPVPVKQMQGTGNLRNKRQAIVTKLLLHLVFFSFIFPVIKYES